MNRYKNYYHEIINHDLILKQNYKSICNLPKLNKMTLNLTSKHYIQEKKNIIPSLLALELMTGQKAKLTYVKKSIASYKIRQGQVIGCKITLRGRFLYRFLNTLIFIILPKIRDFSEISKKNIDSKGNFSIGLKNLMLFPQLENYFDFFDFIKAINYNLAIESKTLNQSFLIYSALQLPFHFSFIEKKSSLLGHQGHHRMMKHNDE